MSAAHIPHKDELIADVHNEMSKHGRVIVSLLSPLCLLPLVLLSAA
jgi:hypothetical protein